MDKGSEVSFLNNTTLRKHWGKLQAVLKDYLSILYQPDLGKLTLKPVTIHTKPTTMLSDISYITNCV